MRDSCRFNTHLMDFHSRAGGSRDLCEKGAFALLGLDQLDFDVRLVRKQDRNHHARKPRTGAQIEPRLRIGRQGEQLGAIGKMAVPDIVEACCGHQIDCALPLAQQVPIAFQLGDYLG